MLDKVLIFGLIVVVITFMFYLYQSREYKISEGKNLKAKSMKKNWLVVTIYEIIIVCIYLGYKFFIQ